MYVATLLDTGLYLVKVDTQEANRMGISPGLYVKYNFCHKMPVPSTCIPMTSYDDSEFIEKTYFVVAERDCGSEKKEYLMYATKESDKDDILNDMKEETPECDVTATLYHEPSIVYWLTWYFVRYGMKPSDAVSEAKLIVSKRVIDLSNTGSLRR